MNKKISFQSILIIILIIFIIIPIFLFFCDFNNFKQNNIINLTKITANYDWLAFVGAWMGSIATFLLGIVSIKQNEELKKINDDLNKTNKNMYEDNLKNLGFSSTDFENEQYLYIIHDESGFKMMPKDENEKNIVLNEIKDNKYKLGEKKNICSGEHNEIRLIINIISKENKNIEKFYLNNMKIGYKKQEDTLNDEIEFEAEAKENYLPIEKTEGNKYNMTLILHAPKNIVQEIEKNNQLTLTFDLNLMNCNSVVTPSWNEIVIETNQRDKETPYLGDRVKYILHTHSCTGRPPRTKYKEIFIKR